MTYSVLDVQSGLSIGVRSREGSNNVGDVNVGDVVLLGEGLQVLLVIGLVILELNKALFLMISWMNGAKEHLGNK